MGQPIEITRTDATSAELRAAAVKISDAAVVRRLLAIALLLEGHSRTAAAEMNAMTRQTLRDWVHRYNDEGVAGLWSRTGPGRTPYLTDEQMTELHDVVIKGPDPERHVVTRWRCFDLRDEIASRWSVGVCEQTVGRWLRQLHLTRLQPRPFHPKKDAEAEVDFKKNSPVW